jgi:hypothetical protein
MKPIEEFQEVRPGLFHWSAFEPKVKADLSCTAISTQEGLLLVDPLPLAEEPLDELVQKWKPCGIVVTSENHERASVDYARRFDVPIYACAEVPGGSPVRENDVIAGALTILELPGFAAGEIALHGRDVLMVGDCLINLDPLGFSVLPAKYCGDEKLGRASLRKLLRFRFEVLTFAHGPPLVNDPYGRLEALLA